MTGVIAFRRKLVHRLNAMASARWQAAAGQPSGDDLKFIARCKSLAVSAETLAPQACADVEAVQADPSCAGRFADLWRELPDALGVTVWPRSAGDLVAWLVHQADHDPTLSRRERIAGRSAQSSGDEAASPATLPSSVAKDFTGALAVVAPVLAVWEATTAVRDWRECGSVENHAPISATVAAVTSEGERNTIGQSGTITFQPIPGAPECRVTISLGDLAVAPGATLSVVPRSTVCEAPLVPATLGDPATSASLALVFAIVGLASLKAWSRLSHCSTAAISIVAGHPPMTAVS